MLERFVLVSSDVENHNLVDTVFILFEKAVEMKISGALREAQLGQLSNALMIKAGGFLYQPF